MDPLADHRQRDGENKYYNYIKAVDFKMNKLLGKDQSPDKEKELQLSPGKEGPITFFPEMEKQQKKFLFPADK